MKNILIALPNDTLGGAEQYLKNISKYYLQRGCFVTICFLKKKEKNSWTDLLIYKNVSFYYTNSSTELSGFLPFLRNIWSIRDLQYDCVFTSHVHLTGILGLCIRLKIIKKIFFIGRESTSIFKRFKGFKLLLFKIQYFLGYRSLDLLICQTSFMKNQFIEGLPKLRQKIRIEVLPNPIDLCAITAYSEGNNSIEFNDFIVSAGRLIHEKGLDILIDAFSILKMKYPDLNLVILGEGDKRIELEEKIKSYNLTDAVFLPGFVDNVYSYFSQAEICVVSSRIEGFPNVLLQMMSQNNNVVSTHCAGGIDEITGLYTCKTHDIHSLYDSMKNALINDNSDKRVLFEEFLVERTIDKFMEKVYSFLNDSKI